MNQILRVRHVKSVRKQRRCIWCAEDIELGSSAVNDSIIFDGEFRSDYFHKECFAAMQKVVAEERYWIEWGPGDYSRGGTESYDEKEWREQMELEEKERIDFVPEPIIDAEGSYHAIRIFDCGDF